MPDRLTPEARAARDGFLARHGATVVPQGAYTVTARDGNRVIGKRIVLPGQAEPDAAVVPLARLRAGRGRVTVEPAASDEVEKTDKAAAGEALRREARRCLRRLSEPGAFLLIAGGAPQAGIFRDAGARDRPIATLPAAIALGFLHREWIALARRGARSEHYRITAAGRDWIERELGERRRARCRAKAAETAAPAPASAAAADLAPDQRACAREEPAPGTIGGGRRIPTGAELRAWRRQGLAAAAIAHRTGLTKSEVQALLFRRGIA